MSFTGNQGLELPDSFDVTDVVSSLTDFSDTVENRLVQRYLSTADRTIRNPTPTTGELSTTIDSGRLFRYNGTSWEDLRVAVSPILSGVTQTAGSNISFTTTETALSTYDLPTVSLVAGYRYEIRIQIQARSSMAGDVLEMRWRKNTAVTGTLIAALRITNLATTNVLQDVGMVVIPATTETIDLKFSAVRTGGSGNCVLSDSTTVPQGYSWSYIRVLGTSSVWRIS